MESELGSGVELTQAANPVSQEVEAYILKRAFVRLQTIILGLIFCLGWTGPNGHVIGPINTQKLPPLLVLHDEKLFLFVGGELPHLCVLPPYHTLWGS